MSVSKVYFLFIRVAHVGWVTEKKNCKVMVLGSGLEMSSTETKGTVLINTAEQVSEKPILLIEVLLFQALCFFFYIASHSVTEFLKK